MQSRDACQTSRRARYAIVVAATVVTTLVVVTAAAVCVCLGLWQLQLVRLGANKHVPKLNASSFHATSSLKKNNTHKTKPSDATRLDASQSQRQQREIIKFSHAGVKY